LSREKELFQTLAKDPDLKAIFFICTGLMILAAGSKVFEKVFGS
jgi:hypothetical protein